MAVRGAQQRIISVIHGWQEVEIRPHRYGGLEFRLGKRELGHIHGDALVDIPFPKAVRNEIVAAGNRTTSCRIRGGSACSCGQMRTLTKRLACWNVPSSWQRRAGPGQQRRHNQSRSPPTLVCGRVCRELTGATGLYYCGFFFLPRRPPSLSMAWPRSLLFDGIAELPLLRPLAKPPTMPSTSGTI